MKIELYYSDNEIEEYLKNKGYTIEEVDVWENYSEYHNKVVTETFKIKIAFKERPNLEKDNNCYRLKELYGLETLFRKHFKETLLKL